MNALTRHTRFDALGTYVFLAVRRPPALRRAERVARRVLGDVDTTCSRFRPDSDLSRANRHAGSWVAVDPLLMAALEVACDAARRTDGLVNPLLGRRLVQLGYDRDFDQLRDCADQVTIAWPEPGPGPDAWREIGIDPTGAVRVPVGTALDLGSVGKAWAADLVAAGIEQELGEPAVVSLGGDVKVASPNGDPWRIAVSERPDGPAEPTQLVDIDAGGLATSSTRIRRWSRRGVARHHLLDPRTGHPAAEVWRTVSASGATCTAANTASTAAVVLGQDAPAWLERHGVAARLVAADGRLVRTGGWPGDGSVTEVEEERAS